jgi:hypothetical protein
MNQKFMMWCDPIEWRIGTADQAKMEIDEAEYEAEEVA